MILSLGGITSVKSCDTQSEGPGFNAPCNRSCGFTICWLEEGELLVPFICTNHLQHPKCVNVRGAEGKT